MFQDYKVAYLRENVKVRKVQRFSFLRTALAYILSLSARQIPHAAMIGDFDVTELLEYCKKKEKELADSPDRMQEDMLFRRAILKRQSAFFLKAIAHSLYKTPCMNGFLDYSPLRTRGTLYQAEDVNIAFTVHTKYGLIRPVMCNAHQKTLVEVAKEMKDFARRARNTDPEELYRGAAKLYLGPATRQLDIRSLMPLFLLIRGLILDPFRPDEAYRKIPPEKKLQAREILGATASLANIGMMVNGHQTVTAIGPPEVMMFGLGDIHLKPKVVGGEVVPRATVTMCGTMDHRAFDAGEGFPFGIEFDRYLQNPGLIYEWKPGDDC